MNQTVKRLLSILLTLTLLLSLAPAVGLAAADDTLIYTLDGTVTDGSNGYATESEITQDGITWMVMGNTTMNPWRIGGKNLSNVDRPIYSQTKMETTVSKVEVTFGTNGLTVNSCKLIVASDASFDADTVIETKNFTFSASSTVTIEPGEGKVWKDAYFKFVFNVTTSGSGNKFFQFNSAKFYEAEAESDTVTFGKVTDVSQIVEENIGECTFEQAKAWVVANWADIVDGVGGDTYIDVLFMVEGQLHLIEFMRGNYNSAEQFDDNYTNDGTGESVTVAAFQDHYNNGDIVYLCGFGAEPAAHTHNFTYTANGATVTASCEGCDITTGLTLTVSAPEGDPVYDGTTTYPATLNDDYNTTAFPGTYEISYTKDGEAFTGDPTEAGTYVASVTVGEDENAVTASVTYTIAKATPAAADFTFTAPESLTYDGSAKAATVVPALGVTGMGEVTVHYYSDAERTTEVLAANVVNAGTYYVGVTAAEGDNYAAATTPLFADGWSFTITKATPELTNVSATAITYGDTLAQSTVTGTATNPISSANVPGTWAFTEGETAPVVADSNTTEYEVTFTPTDGDNYETATAMITLTVNKADPTFTAPEAKLLVYTGSEQELVTAGATEDGTILFSTDGENFEETIPTAMDYGTYDVWYKVVGDANHNDTEPVKLTSVIGLTIAGANTESAPVSFVENGERLYRYDVTIENIPENFEAIGLQVFLSFDADVLTFIRVESDFDYVIAQKDNTVQLAWASDTEGVLEDGQVLFSIIFAAPDCEAGTETAIPFTVNALNVASSVAVVKDGKVVSLPTFTVDGCIRFSVPLWGDANCDGVVTAADAALILRSVVGLSALSAVGAFNGDVDGDLAITAADAALILRYVVGLIDLFPVEENN